MSQCVRSRGSVINPLKIKQNGSTNKNMCFYKQVLNRSTVYNKPALKSRKWRDWVSTISLNAPVREVEKRSGAGGGFRRCQVYRAPCEERTLLSGPQKPFLPLLWEITELLDKHAFFSTLPSPPDFWDFHREKPNIELSSERLLQI